MRTDTATNIGINSKDIEVVESIFLLGSTIKNKGITSKKKYMAD